MLEIIKILGAPNSRELKEMNPAYKGKDFPQYKTLPLEMQFLPDTDP